MPDRLYICVCEFFQDELRRVLETEAFTDVEARTFPGYCVRPPHEGRLISRQAWRDGLEGDRSAYMIGGCCLDALDREQCERENTHLLCMDQCHKLVAGEALVEYHLGRGGYLVTPGWLRLWRSHINGWGFDRDTARGFFGESTRSLVLLDTGIDEESPARLEEFSAFLDIPGEIVPVGLNMFRSHVRASVQEWRLEKERSAHLQTLSLVNRRMADYEMSFDLISRLVDAGSEDDAIRQIFELFTMLFAPSAIHYVSLGEGGGIEVWSQPEEDLLPNGEVERMLELAEDYALSVEGGGFQLRISHLGESLGILELEDVAFEEYREHYMNVSITLSLVCGLAIASARQREKLFKANQELEGYAYTVSHDIKGPLANMVSGSKSLIELLQADDWTDRGDEIASISRILEKSAERGIYLSDELLELARAGQVTGRISWIEVAPVIRRIIEEKAVIIEEKGAVVQSDEDMGRIFANPAHIYQLFANLIGNALKYCDNPAPRVEVRNLGLQRGRGHRYSVCDNGPGIPEGSIDRIFDPFFKGEQGGSGIGLAIVHKIIRTYGGEIQVYNRDGACFEFTLHDHLRAKKTEA